MKFRCYVLSLSSYVATSGGYAKKPKIEAYGTEKAAISPPDELEQLFEEIDEETKAGPLFDHSSSAVNH